MFEWKKRLSYELMEGEHLTVQWYMEIKVDDRPLKWPSSSILEVSSFWEFFTVEPGNKATSTTPRLLLLVKEIQDVQEIAGKTAEVMWSMEMILLWDLSLFLSVIDEGSCLYVLPFCREKSMQGWCSIYVLVTISVLFPWTGASALTIPPFQFTPFAYSHLFHLFS